MGKKIAISMVVVVVLLVLAVGYIVYDKYSDWKQNRELGIYQQGAQIGFEQAIVQVAQQAVTCQQVPLNVGNQTVNIVAVDCLNSGS